MSTHKKVPINIIGLGTPTKFTLSRFLDQPLHNVSYHLVDTAPANNLPNQISFHLIGRHAARGLGCGGDTNLGKKAAEESIDTLWELIPKTGKTVFLASMASGTGAGVLPVFLRLAKEKKVEPAAVVTMPLANEGTQRSQTATRNLKQLDHLENDLIVIGQKNLERFLPNKTFVDSKEAYNLLGQIVMWKTLAYLSE